MIVRENFEEMNKLVGLLCEKKIPFKIVPRVDWELETNVWTPSFAILVTDDDHKKCIMDAVCHPGTYGWKYYHDPDSNQTINLIEIMGHSNNSDITDDDVVGYLTAEEAIEYFVKAWTRYSSSKEA